jgi:hypothetical protein
VHAVDGCALSHVGAFARVESVDVCAPWLSFGPTAFRRIGYAARNRVRHGHGEQQAACLVGDDRFVSFAEPASGGILGMKCDCRSPEGDSALSFSSAR